MSSSLCWSHLLTVAVTTFVCTLSGLYIHRHFTTNESIKKEENKSDKMRKSKNKAIAFWEKAHFDESVTSEWLADWDDLRPFVLSQLTKIMNVSKKKKSDLKILILGNGKSAVPNHLFLDGFTNIIATDICSNVIEAMKQKYPFIKWSVVDCTQTKQHFAANSFDFIFEKGVSDTLQYRQNSKSSTLRLQSMFDQISQILDKQNGKFLVVTPRRKVPLLKLAKFEWSVKRMQMQQIRDKKESFLYVHVCTKMNEHNHLNVISKQQTLRRKQFEKSTLCELNCFDFDPLIQINDVQRDIAEPFAKYENVKKELLNNESNGCRLSGIIKEIDSFYAIHGIVEFKRKFGKKLMFYRVSVLNDRKKKTLQCIAERAFVANLKNPLFKQEFATNYLTKCGDEVVIYGKVGLTNKGILALFVYYVSLIQYHPNWKYE